MIVSLVAASVAQAQSWPPGANLEDAAAVQVSRAGFDSLASLVPGLIPTDAVPIDPVTQGGTLYEISLSNAWVGLEATDVDLVPAAGVLEVDIDLLVNINDPDVDPLLGLPPRFDLHYEALGLSDDCLGFVDPFPVAATVPFSLSVVTGPEGKPVLDATMGDVVVTNELGSEHIHLECATGSLFVVDSFLDKWLGFSFVDLMIGFAEPLIQQQIEDQQADLEAQLEDALASAYLDQDVDVNGVPLHLELYPQDVDITPDGMDLRMQGSASAPPAECTEEFDVLGGSVRSDGAPPDVTDVPATADLGVVLGDDWPNQALYAIWRGGVLCYDLSAGGIDLPIALDTSLLGLLGGDPFRALWPDPLPMVVRTEPREQPTVDYDGVHDVGVAAHDVGVEFYAELDYRTVHALGIAIDLDAGVDLALDPTTGQLGVEVALGDDEIGVRVPSNDFTQGTEAQIATTFEGLVGSFIEPLLGDALQSLAFGMPNLNGVGLTALDVAPHGDATWLGAWAALGPVSYEGSAGCGCGGSGTDTGDTANGGGTCRVAPGAPFGAVLVAGVLLRRRRRI